ncbi:hypothetical protein DOTSEDRAFT_29700 [Dothistroma septosporum NZE10]|uniref:Uncharacterized protein n=1 Tax=Dothistroma septosporum (strain NZE10 / CBS 128990) TaxID=675120 RepID=M2YHV0_DOTSN|nr:hypothetical protein DOTSEDRAFT_29700 [Dothistroma septosporum NZE10]
MWELDIVRGGYSTTQEQDRQHARDNIKTAAETLGLTVPWNDPPRFASVSRPPAPRTIRETAPRMSRTLLSGSATSSIANTRKRTRDSTTAYDYDATSEAVLNEPKRARTNKSTSCRSGGDAWLQSFGEQNEGETRYPTISSQQTGIDRGAFASNNVSRGDNDLASPAMQSVSSNDRGNATATSDQPQLPSHYGGSKSSGATSARIALDFTDDEKRSIVTAINGFDRDETSRVISASPDGHNTKVDLIEDQPLPPDVFDGMLPANGIPIARQARVSRALTRITTAQRREQMTRALAMEIERRKKAAEEASEATGGQSNEAHIAGGRRRTGGRDGG